MAEKGYDYSPAHRALEVVGIMVFCAFAIGCAYRMAIAVDSLTTWLTVVPAAALSGYLLADLISGTVHWLADRFGTPETPIFGPSFIIPFRNHHVFPKEITEHDFIETNGNNCIVSFWVLICGFFLIDVPYGDHGQIFWLGLTLFSMIAIMATNQLHKWAHADDPPAAVRLLQKLHLVLPPDHHGIHHTSPFDTYYCITTGWLNWPLRKIRFFETLEWIARQVGFRPGTDDAKTVASSGTSA